MTNIFKQWLSRVRKYNTRECRWFTPFNVSFRKKRSKREYTHACGWCSKRQEKIYTSGWCTSCFHRNGGEK